MANAAKPPAAKSFNIDRFLDGTKNRIALVGVELEGAWTNPKLPLQRDGSVFGDKAPAGHVIGELPLGPVQPVVIGKLITTYYPDKVNQTCGLHVHMSFETLRHYGLLMVPEYQETILEYLGRWAIAEGFPDNHYIWPRLRGEIEYCKKEFNPDMQTTTKRKDWDHFRHGNRYTVIHYCGRLKTIECRVLPMMQKPDQAVRGVKEVLRITNACLRMLGAKKDERFAAKLELPSGDICEEHIEDLV